MDKLEKVKTSENSSIKSTGKMFFLQLLLGRHFESAQVHVGSSTPQEAAEPVISCHTLFITRYTQAHYATRSFMGACKTKGYSSLQKYTEARRMI